MKFYRPDPLSGANQQNTLGFVFAASIMAPEGEGALLPFISSV